MGISVFPAPAAGAPSDNWVTVSTVSPTSGTSSVSFTSLSGYKKYMLKIIDPEFSANGLAYVTINSDSGSKYSWASPGQTTTAISRPIFAIESTRFQVHSTVSGGSLRQVLIIQSADTTGAKVVSGWAQYNDASNTVSNTNINGVYFGSAAVTSIQLTLSGITFGVGGSLTLYGAA